MYNKLKLQYADGTKQNFNTEPMGRNMARELMLTVFYQHSGEGGSQIVSARFYQEGKGKPLFINREAL